MQPIILDQTRLFVGTSGWTYEDWKDDFYPTGLPKNRWFNFYADHFSAVEVNATFYRTFQDTTYLNWKKRAPADFRYVLKAPQTITHRKMLSDAGEEIEHFARSAELLGESLGFILLQMPPAMPYQPQRLAAALRAFPDPRRVAVEFRGAAWLIPQTEDLLRELGVTYCNVDSPQQTIGAVVTSSSAYLRLHGRRSWYTDRYSQEELREVAGWARGMVQRGVKQVAIFFNNTFAAHGPHNAQALLRMLQPESSA